MKIFGRFGEIFKLLFFFLKLPYLAIGSRGSTTCDRILKFLYFSVCFLLDNQIWLNPLVPDCHF
jgi:hypothetical protein